VRLRDSARIKHPTLRIKVNRNLDMVNKVKTLTTHRAVHTVVVANCLIFWRPAVLGLGLKSSNFA